MKLVITKQAFDEAVERAVRMGDDYLACRHCLLSREMNAKHGQDGVYATTSHLGINLRSTEDRTLFRHFSHDGSELVYDFDQAVSLAYRGHKWDHSLSGRKFPVVVKLQEAPCN